MSVSHSVQYPWSQLLYYNTKNIFTILFADSEFIVIFAINNTNKTYFSYEQLFRFDPFKIHGAEI